MIFYSIVQRFVVGDKKITRFEDVNKEQDGGSGIPKSYGAVFVARDQQVAVNVFGAGVLQDTSIYGPFLKYNTRIIQRSHQ